LRRAGLPVNGLDGVPAGRRGGRFRPRVRPSRHAIKITDTDDWNQAGMPLPLFTVLGRAFGQFDDRVFVGVVLRAVAWSALSFALLHLLAVEIVRSLLADPDQPVAALPWLAGILAWFGASLLTLWLFVPTAAAIAALYVDRIARAVEHRYYPDLPEPPGAPILEQLVDAAALAIRLAAFGLLALLVALLIPGLGVVCGWAITGYALGRGLFLSVAMRRLPRLEATRLYRRYRGAVLAPGFAIAMVVWVPIVNLFVPVIAVAAMVHVLDGIMRG
jgi:CysZ protein